jgi:hypothetical protein
MAVKRWVWIAVGLVGSGVLVFVAFVAATVYMVAQHVEIQPSNRPAAEREFDEVRAKFAGQSPLIDADRLDVGAELPQVERGKPPIPLEALRVVVWDPDEDQLVRVTIPFWVVRLGGWKALDLRSDDLDLRRIRVTAEDLERHGPRLILDHRDHGGTRVLVWTE